MSTQNSRKKWTGIAAAAVLGGGLLVGTTALIVGGDNAAAPAPPAPTRMAPPPVPTDEAPSGNQALPTEGPVARWELFQRIAVPMSAEAGPHRIDQAVAEDYQRSPAGALIAAWQINTRRLVAPGDQWRAVVERQILPGPGRDAYLQARSSVTDPTLTDDQITQLAGFRFVTYSPDIAVIQLASKSRTGTLVGTTTTMRWVEGDWRLELQPNGATSPTSTVLQDLSFYTPWSGV